MAYKDRWVSPDLSPALDRGTLWHAVLEQHYLALQAIQRDPEMLESEKLSLLHEAVAPLLREPSGEQTETQELIEWMYIGYLEQYGLDLDWRILAVEHSSEIYLPTVTGARSGFKLKVKIDLIVQAMGRIWIVDHKSCRNLPTDKELDLDEQFGLYTWAMQKMGKKVHGSIYSAARTQRNKTGVQTLDSRFLRHPMYRNEHELGLIAVEAWRSIKSAYAIPPGEAERHPNTDTCRWKCNFLAPCLGSRKGASEVEFLLDLGYRQDRTRH